MADGFGLKIGVEGERDFKKSLSEINQTFKVLGSEMKLVQSQFDKNDNSVEALTARNATLNKQIDAQKEKINTLKAALENAASSFGENDRRTQAWQVQLNNAQAALNKMEREVAQNNQALDNAGNEFSNAEKKAPVLLPQRIARSRAIIVATAPSIFSVDFSLSALMFPAGSVRM